LLLRWSGHYPKWVGGYRCFIGHQCAFAVAARIEIGDDVLIAGGTQMADNDGHPLDPEKRRRGEPVDPDDVNPVTFGNNVMRQLTALSNV